MAYFNSNSWALKEKMLAWAIVGVLSLHLDLLDMQTKLKDKRLDNFSSLLSDLNLKSSRFFTFSKGFRIGLFR